MFSEEEEAALRRLLKERDDTRHLPDDKIGFSQVGLPETRESLFWECVGMVNNFPLWLGKSRCGKIVCAWIIGVGIWQSIEWTNSHVVQPLATDVPVVAQCVSDFLTTPNAKLFPSSGKDKFLAFSNPVDHVPVDLMIPASSGIVPETIVDHGLPPNLLWHGYNNSQFVSRENARRIQMMNEQIRRQNAGNNQRPPFLG